MLRGHKKVWMHYIKDIIASDVYSAVFLASYMRQSAIYHTYAPYLEVVDLQKYKIVKQPKKVKQAIRERKDIPFVFVIGKN